MSDPVQTWLESLPDRGDQSLVGVPPDSLRELLEERDKYAEAFIYMADSGAKLDCGNFNGELKWWLEWHQWGETQADTFSTPLEAVRAAIDPVVTGGQILVSEKEHKALKTELAEAYAEMRKQRKTTTAVYNREVW